MSQVYYKFPLQIADIFQNKSMIKCDLGESVSQNLQLIIMSHNGEHRYNESYGCEIWDLDFDLIMNVRIWEEKLRKSLINGILENEKRIEKIDVEVKVSEAEENSSQDNFVSIKRKVDVFVNALIVETGESYHFETNLYLGPVSYIS